MHRHLTPSALATALALALGVGLVAILVLSPAGAPLAWADGGEAAHKALVRDYYETVLNGGDFAALERFVASGSEREAVETVDVPAVAIYQVESGKLRERSS